MMKTAAHRFFASCRHLQSSLFVMAAVAFAAGCATIDWVDTPIARVPSVVYDGQTVKIPSDSFEKYTWVSSNPDNGKALTDPSTGNNILLFNMDGIVTKSAGVANDAPSVLFTAVDKAHPEYTYDLKVEVHPWNLAVYSETGEPITRCAVGSTVEIGLRDFITGEQILDIWDGNTVDSKREVKLQLSDPIHVSVTSEPSSSIPAAPLSVSEHSEDRSIPGESVAELLSSGSFFANYRLNAAGTYTFIATLLNGCSTDVDITRSVSIEVE